jgi:uncharacterized damage-inducible protein DinB
MNYREHLSSSLAYLAPDKTLEGLTPAAAERHVSDSMHSIAEIIAHMTFWQDWFLARCLGDVIPMPASASEGWPAVASGSWADVRTRFLDGLQKLDGLPAAAHTTPITPPIEFPPLATCTVGEALIHVSMHNSHHLGQVILLRQLLGCWPPPAGSYTW